FYSSRQFIDDAVKGVTGSGIGIYMVVYGNGFEGSSGGPFFRDIDNQGGSTQELYFYMVRLRINIHAFTSAHDEIEFWSHSNRKMGLHGPYALVFTSGGAPSANIDPLFWEGISVQGYVGQSGRGRVTGRASGFPSQFSSLISVGFSNSNAEYWVRTDTSGNFVSPYMKPGTYTMTLYSVELAIGSQSVSVSAGGTTSANIASTAANPSVIWQIGDLDGTPRGFLNAEWVFQSLCRCPMLTSIVVL
ncbi:galactose mutarotase-like protein, partial [Marasmius fiardii PR-910]